MCEEKNRLMQQSERLALALGRSLTALNRRACDVDNSDYSKLKDFVELARLEARRAHVVLDAHVREHKC